MQFMEIFYCVFWLTTILVVWFHTDWVEHYLQLFGLLNPLRLKYKSFVLDNPDKYFPDFLYQCSLTTSNRFVKFGYKLMSCPFCLNFWLAICTSLIFSKIEYAGIFYIIPIIILLQIKKMT